MNAKTIWQIIKSTFEEFNKDNAFILAGALAYYAIFALPPMLVIIISTAGIFFSEQAVKGELFYQIREIVGDKGAGEIQSMLQQASDQSKNKWAAILSIITLLFGATGLFYMLQLSLNIIWSVKPKPKIGWFKFIKDRFFSFLMVLFIGLLLIMSLIINALLSMLKDFLLDHFPESTLYLFQALNHGISLAVITLLFAMIFKFLPDARIRWRDVWAGAFVTAVLFIIGKFLIGFYLGQSDLGSAYGAAGSIIILLVWIFYSSLLLIMGAEFTQVYALRYGKQIQPVEYAVRIKREEIEEEGEKGEP